MLCDYRSRLMGFVPQPILSCYTHTISDILDLVAQMNAVNTDDVLPLLNPLDATQLLRTDEVTESNLRELYQSVAPRVEDGLYLVPKVIE
jgi:aspartyl-tRNA(Asn)/glutamyl-tRNA(Gln) amidotransferase subunit C